MFIIYLTYNIAARVPLKVKFFEGQRSLHSKVINEYVNTFLDTSVIPAGTLCVSPVQLGVVE